MSSSIKKLSVLVISCSAYNPSINSGLLNPAIRILLLIIEIGQHNCRQLRGRLQMLAFGKINHVSF